MKNYIVLDFPTPKLTAEEKQEILRMLSPYFEKKKLIITYYMKQKQFWANESDDYEKLKYTDWYKLHDTIFYCVVNDCMIQKDVIRTKYNHYSKEKQCVFFIKRNGGHFVFCVRRVGGIMDSGDTINIYSSAEESYHTAYGTIKINKTTGKYTITHEEM